MRKRSGRRFQLREERSDELREALLHRYAQHELFVADLQGVYRQYQRLLRALVSTEIGIEYGCDDPLGPEFAYSAARGLAKGRTEYLPSGQERRSGHGPLKRYLLTIESLAIRWGLDCAWAAPYLHWALIDLEVLARISGKPQPWRLRWLLNGYSWRALNEPITVEVEPEEDETWKEFSRRVIAVARIRWEAFQQYMQNNPQWMAVSSKPALRDHVEWLFLHICPGENNRPRGWNAIAQEAKTSHLTVRNAVLDLAKQLEIKLPNIPPGRPRRVPYRSSSDPSS